MPSMREVDLGEGWTVREVAGKSATDGLRFYFFKKQRAIRIPLDGVLVQQMAGYSLIEKIRLLEATNDRQTPAVALTSHVSIEDRARALSAGFNMFVPKPVEPDELITAIANLAAPADPPV